MEIGSAGAGSVAQIAPTQTGSQQQVVQAQAQQEKQVEQNPQPEQQSSPSASQRVGTVVDVQI
ncbi:hypothetical protein [Paraglaciecola sp.]|uniref:hypothetical protein n=1 Tax=Paraglaciecola sp. TaxID=1920173 RepID=UPI0030F398CC